jgi:hypothetical protein
MTTIAFEMKNTYTIETYDIINYINSLKRVRSTNDKNNVCLSRQYMQIANGGICVKGYGKKTRAR